MNYHGRLMNLQPDYSSPESHAVAYKRGYRDARHAAAEVANEADSEIERLREENNVLSAREARAENSALHLGALVDELRGLLRDINSRPRHLNAGAWEIRLYQDDYDRIDAALAGEPEEK